MGGYSWKGNSSFSFAIRYSCLAHKEACEAGPSVHFFLMLQTMNGFCKLSLIRRPTFFITYSTKKCKSHLAIEKKTKQKIRGRGGLFLLFFASSVVLQGTLLITCSILLSPFCSSAFYLRVFTSAMPCSRCF